MAATRSLSTSWREMLVICLQTSTSLYRHTMELIRFTQSLILLQAKYTVSTTMRKTSLEFQPPRQFLRLQPLAFQTHRRTLLWIGASQPRIVWCYSGQLQQSTLSTQLQDTNLKWTMALAANLQVFTMAPSIQEHLASLSRDWLKVCTTLSEPTHWTLTASLSHLKLQASMHALHQADSKNQRLLNKLKVTSLLAGSLQQTMAVVAFFRMLFSEMMVLVVQLTRKSMLI
jgi:hypothetical protein